MHIYPIVLSQGSFIHRDSLTFSFEERGLLFGDGVYEVIRIYNGEYYLLVEHVERLFRSLREIKLNVPYTKQQLIVWLQELLKRNSMDTDGKVYLQITRGAAKRDHPFPQNTEPSLFAYLETLGRNMKNMSEGVHVITAPDIRWEFCHVKSINLLPNVLAKQEAIEKGCFEAILHKNGLITECSATNVFLVKDGKIITHPVSNRILSGCVRMAVKKFAASLNIPFIEKPFTIDDIPFADEMFLTSSTTEITPIVKVDEHWIKDSKPGNMTRKIQQAYAKDANIEPITGHSA